MRIVFSTRLSGSCKLLFDCDLYHHIVLTTHPQPPSSEHPEGGFGRYHLDCEQR